ncbi:hypothetical protein GWI33_013203 [Rhynchophorus ferrugineus]|uniref:Uncharacterized protein n=1 Tax=Rhynchophorus ferrugineus TaxID=354439 RepID=A0A834M6V0_RHYFE|nr:hypothetical protein GWI33_013203 [Rhynchophorus ferrugineus]
MYSKLIICILIWFGYCKLMVAIMDHHHIRKDIKLENGELPIYFPNSDRNIINNKEYVIKYNKTKSNRNQISDIKELIKVLRIEIDAREIQNKTTKDTATGDKRTEAKATNAVSKLSDTNTKSTTNSTYIHRFTHIFKTILNGSSTDGSTITDNTPTDGSTITDNTPTDGSTITDNTPTDGSTITDSSPTSGSTTTDSSPTSGSTTTDSTPTGGSTITDSTPTDGSTITTTSSSSSTTSTQAPATKFPMPTDRSSRKMPSFVGIFIIIFCSIFRLIG